MANSSCWITARVLSAEARVWIGSLRRVEAVEAIASAAVGESGQAEARGAGAGRSRERLPSFR
jgi:hypothetical protein